MFFIKKGIFMSKEEILNKLKEIKGNYSLVFFSEGLLKGIIVLTINNNNLYSIFKINGDNVIILESDLQENKAIKKYASLII
jgi:hypothetical protein